MGQYPICAFTSNINITKRYNIFLYLDSMTMKDLEILVSSLYFSRKGIKH